jgi:glycosyltransferase involved in cell wall biosynthesis
MTTAVRTGFVMEQSLGHVTHYRNLREFTSTQHDIDPVWLPIPFAVRGAARLVPLLRGNWSVRASWRARRAIDAVSGPLDALVFHTQVTSLFATKLMRQIPTLISLDATPINYDSMGEHYAHRPAGTGFLDRRKFELNRRAFEAATCLVTWSDWARRSLVDDYGVDAGRVRVLAPGANEAYFEIGRRRPGLATEQEARRTRLLFVGGDFARKGGPQLLESLSGELGEMCELHLVTHAEVPSRPNVIVHRGLQANSPELLRLYAEADVFVLPTLGDCLAVALMEATAAGLSVITTNVGALSESVVHGESGLLVQPGNVSELTSAITTLARDAHLRRRMGAASHVLATQKFNAHNNNRVLLNLVVQVAETRGVSRRAA